METAETCHINLGTGGNFTLNGTIATSERGANQDNCVASYLLSDADYLYKSGTFAFSKQLTYSCTLKKGQSYGTLFYGVNVGETRNTLIFDFGLDYISLQLVNSSNQYILNAKVSNIILLATNTLTLSLDLASTALRKVFLNGVDITSSVTWTTYNTASSAENISRFTINGYGLGAGLMNVYMGELYFDTRYTDLSTSNPFWDADTNKPIPVRKVIADTGVTPLIAMPLDASNPGKNYGSGGDFVANSAPYIGSRGASEFWCRSILVDATKYLTYTGGLFCASLVKWVSTDSGVTWAVSYLNNVTVTNIGNGTDNGRVAYYFGTSEVINWALEINKLRFTDGLGFPIPPIIDNNTLLYLPFNDSSNFSKNDGSANDLIITGVISQSSDVKG